MEECVVVLIQPEIPNLGRLGPLNRTEVEQKQSPSRGEWRSSAPHRAPGRRAVVFHTQASQRSPKTSKSGAQAPQKGCPGGERHFLRLSLADDAQASCCWRSSAQKGRPGQ
ncbi:hypothetical protein LR48_Vigan07g152500 [Vigna angularis]|uniref:Uncharacterized protein n=1 Tax=Phaseolus angularis TaxID=3914 RepID=A0A0L9UYP3_PHAAN|nr:hypothetical protein LR48_Vigan07g152500 [Vigna angularis]